MNGSNGVRTIGWTMLIIALLSAIAAILSVLFGSLRELDSYVELIAPRQGGSLAESLLFVARSYRLRQSILNTVTVAGMVGVVLFALSYALYGRVLTQVPRWLIALLLTPLFLPIPVAALLWKPIFAPIDLTYRPFTGVCRLRWCSFGGCGLWR